MKNPFWILLVAAVLIAGTLGAPAAHAQVLYGSIVGEVTDASGAVIPNATVTAKNTETGLSRTATTDGGGRYSFVNVLPGKYTLNVVGTGFRTFVATDFEVSPNTVARVDAKLEVGQITDQVTVTGETIALQTDKADTHSEIDTKAITSLPISGYRNYQSLINLVPGAMPAQFQNSITDTPGRALATHINGGKDRKSTRLNSSH